MVRPVRPVRTVPAVDLRQAHTPPAEVLTVPMVPAAARTVPAAVLRGEVFVVLAELVVHTALLAAAMVHAAQVAALTTSHQVATVPLVALITDSFRH